MPCQAADPGGWEVQERAQEEAGPGLRPALGPQLQGRSRGPAKGLHVLQHKVVPPKNSMLDGKGKHLRQTAGIQPGSLTFRLGIQGICEPQFLHSAKRKGK